MEYDFRTVKLSRGGHHSREEGMCVMELCAYLAGEEHSDAPRCACPIISNLAICANDTANDAQRQEYIAPLPWRIIGTRTFDTDINLKRLGLLEKFTREKIVKMIKRSQAAYDVLKAQLGDSDFKYYEDKSNAYTSIAGHVRMAQGCVDEFFATAGVLKENLEEDTLLYTLSEIASEISNSFHYLCCVVRWLHEISVRAGLKDVCRSEEELRGEIVAELANLLDQMIRITEPQENVAKEPTVDELIALGGACE